MVRRVLTGLATILVLVGIAMLPELANPASGSVTQSRVGTVFPSTLSAGDTTRFCGAGYAPDAPVAVLVGERETRGTRATREGGFCIDLRASSAAQGPSRLVAFGRSRTGGTLQTTGGATITQSAAAVRAASPVHTVTSLLLASGSRLVVELWAAAAVLAVVAGLSGIAAQRRRCAAEIAALLPVKE